MSTLKKPLINTPTLTLREDNGTAYDDDKNFLGI